MSRSYIVVLETELNQLREIADAVFWQVPNARSLASRVVHLLDRMQEVSGDSGCVVVRRCPKLPQV